MKKLIRHEGITLSITEWAARVGMKRVTLSKRLQKGVPFKRAIDPTSMRNSTRWYKKVGIGYQRAEYEHRLIVEKAIGKKLPAQATVHHIDGDRANNSNHNLLVCQDAAYHNLIHYRTDALAASGNASYVKCCYCKEWGPPDELTIVKLKKRCMHAYHKSCNKEYQRKYRLRKRSS